MPEANIIGTRSAAEQFVCENCGAEIESAGVAAFTETECPSCGSTVLVPGRFGSFKLLKLLGTGGMGGVYLAEDESLGRKVALKVMQRELGENVEFVERFRREAQAAAKLNHPNIAQIYSFGQVEGQPYIVMELVTGEPFDKRVESPEPLPVPVVLKVASDIADGLRDAAEIGLTHGDIKPENILIDDRLQAKLVDFGIASFAGKRRGSEVWGTPYYIAPEAVKRQRTDARSDIYSLGATMYHALAGCAPFDGETPTDVVKARFKEPPKPLRELREDINPQVDAIVMRMLEKEPGRRYPTYESLLSDMEKAMTELGPVRSTGSTGRLLIRKKTTRGVTGEAGSGGKKLVVPRASSTAWRDSRATTSSAPVGREGDTSGKKRVAVVLALAFAGLILVAGAVVGVIFLLNAIEEKANPESVPEEENGALSKPEKGPIASGALADLKGLIDDTETVLESVGSYATTAATLAGQATNMVFEAVERSLPYPTLEKNTIKPESLSSGKVALVTFALNSYTAGSADYEATYADIYATAGGVFVAEAEAKSLLTRLSAKMEEAKKEEQPGKIAAITDLGRSAETNRLARLQREATTFDELLEEGRLKLGPLENQLTQAVKLAAEEARRAREAAAAEKAEAERRAAENARRAKIAREKRAVENRISELATFFKRNRFEQVTRELTYFRSKVATPPATRKLNAAIERYQLMADVRKNLETYLEQHVLKGGWREGGRLFDVVGSDALFVTWGERQKVLWENVKADQMFVMFSRFSGLDELDRKERYQRLLTVSVFCFESARQEPDVMKQAVRYAEKAIEVRPSQKIPLSELMPGILEHGN